MSFDLQRFIDAQETGGVYEAALAELRRGRKTSHWMWFVFPQIAGLGRSSTAQFYALGSLAEAQAYLEHPLLGARLRSCCTTLTSLPGSDPVAVFGPVDALKLRSSMTLFVAASPAAPEFREVLSKYFDGEEDDATLALI